MAMEEKDPLRKEELEQIAKTCDWVPANPARTFQEALQGYWFTHLALMKEEPFPGGHCLGRIDQWLYPFFRDGLLNGTLTLQQAAEYLGLLWLKLNELESIRDYITSRSAAGSLLQQATIGGQGVDGRDKTNLLSYLILEVTRQMAMPQPGVYIRWNPDIDSEFMQKAVQTNRDTHGGLPAFLNDRIAIKSLIAKGVAREDAVEWSGAGCLFYIMGHCQMAPKVLACLNDAKVFEVTLYNGLDPRTGKQVGLRTGDPRTFCSMEELFAAWEKQYEYFVDKMMEGTSAGIPAMIARYASPLTSALVDDCIEKGYDVFEGGERYPHLQYMYQHRGHVDVADSFVAIKKLVFDEKKITMDELLNALASNFEGEYEHIRALCLKAPKYGNDDDYADEIFNYVSITTNRILLDRGRQWKIERIGRPALTLHYYHGQVVGALPNGRKAGMPLCDAALSPLQGFDINGPTALIKSATKANHHPPEMNGIILNMKVSPSLLSNREQIKRFINLIEVFFERGGWHIQFNIIDRETLLNAQKHPEQYRNLMVRVAGYSAYFVDLPKDVQDEIIQRTEHGLS
jgi:formate C-acetyltransferase